MNQKKNFGMLLEGIRQCKMIGIMGLVLLVLGAVLLPLGEAISSMNYDDTIAFVAEAWQANPFLLLVVPAAGLMTLTLFHFLDTRVASDLYHALPHKRITLYASYAGAILVWTLLLVVVSTLCSTITCLILHKTITLMLSTVIPFAAAIFLMSTLLVSGILIAITLSGTVFTNVVLSGAILILPRLSYNIIHALSYDNVPFIQSATQSGIFRNANNLLFGFLSSVMGMDGTVLNSVLQPDWQSIVYTLVLSLIYLAIGGWLFCRRSSEAAGQSAPTRMHQHVYRIVITMAYCLIVTAALTSEVAAYGIGYLEAVDIFGFGILYLIGILIYLIYELITTKKWRNLLTSLPGLGIVVVLNIAIALTMGGVIRNAIAQRPSASEIESISIGTDARYLNGSAYWDYQDYVNMKTGAIEITDSDAISLVSYYLDENVQTWQDHGSDVYWNKYYGENAVSYTEYNITIRTGSKTLYRTINIPEEETEKLNHALTSTEAYTDAWLNPPEPVSMDTIYVEGNEANSITEQETLEEIYQTYREELGALSFEDLSESFAKSHLHALRLCYSFSEDGYTRTISCPINEDIMPKTAQLYYGKIYEEQKENFQDLQNIINSGEYPSFYFDCFGMDEEENYLNIYNSFDDIQILEKIMPYFKDEPISDDCTYTVLWLYPAESDYHTSSIGLTIATDDAIFQDQDILKACDADTNYYGQ